MDYYSMAAIGITFALGIAAAAGAIGQSLVTQKALSGLTRQPEVKVWIMILMVLGLAFIESLVIYCMVISFTMVKDPFKVQVANIASIDASRPVATHTKTEY